MKQDDVIVNAKNTNLKNTKKNCHVKLLTRERDYQIIEKIDI